MCQIPLEMGDSVGIFIMIDSLKKPAELGWVVTGDGWAFPACDPMIP